jgi:endonuclease/exonuclease/phosphatase (EEP) superfamily protein YafD
MPLPERTIHGVVDLDGRTVRLASYHAPPDVSWFLKKPQQAVAFANWLATLTDPVILGADANTPLIDAPDFDAVRTRWHSGSRRLNGAPGDDLLWAPRKIHGLDDALRRWLAEHPEAMAAIRSQRPSGPLAVSHRTGKRRSSPGIPRRFDSIWISDHFTVTAVRYPYDEAVRAGSDHAAVVVDLDLGDHTANAR